MPQMKVEKKFFRVRVDKFLQQIAPIINAVAGFQGFELSPKNIMAGVKSDG